MESNNNIENVHNEISDQDCVSIHIKEKLGELPSTSSHAKSIFKVPNELLLVNKKEYKPEYVGIGPYHHYDSRLLCKEEKKLRCLDRMLKKREGSCVDGFVRALRKIEAQTRQQYVETFTLSPEQFIEMMLLDGCFILEFIHTWISMVSASRLESNPVFGVDCNLFLIRRDLMLLENQLPFIVLTTLDDLLKNHESSDERYSLIDSVLTVFSRGAKPSLRQEMNDYQHLLDIVYQGMISMASQEKLTEDCSKERSIPSATELEESGIKFRLSKSDWVLDIKFKKGALEIPSIMMVDGLESFFRNLVAYEQQWRMEQPMYVTEYVVFLDCLINTPKDIELLRQKKIITNTSGDDEGLSKLFNKLSENTVASSRCYGSVMDKINEHCNKPRNRWVAMLRRDYFHSPWALISVFAAIVLLLLALMQTVYTVISYYKKD